MESNEQHIIKLISESRESHFEAVKELSFCLKNHHDITIFRQNNGLRMILDFVEEDHFPVEALRILAYCSTDNKTKLQILQWNSITQICKLLKTLKDKDTLKVVCKVVGNLCRNKLCRYSIHDNSEALDSIVACLSWSEVDDSFMNVYLKTLRSLSRSKEHCERMVGRGVVRGVCSLLKRNLSSNLVREVLISINHFLKRCSSEVRIQFLEAETLKTMMKLVRNKDSASPVVSQFILSKLLPNQELLRYFGSSGILRLFISSYTDAATSVDKDKFLRCILTCCGDASNRATALEDFRLLDLLLSRLDDPQANHNLLLRTIICFKYNSEATNHLISHHLISSCIKLLSEDTSFNLAEMTSSLLYAGGGVANSVTINTPVSPSTFNEGYNQTSEFGEGQFDTPCSSKSENHKSNLANGCEFVNNHTETNHFNEESYVNKRVDFNEMSSEDEDMQEDEFLEEDKHLYQLAKMFEVDRRNRLVYSQVSSVCEELEEEEERRPKKRKAKMELCSKKMKLQSDFCLKSTLDRMISPLWSRSVSEGEESTQSCIINLLSHLVGHPATEKHLNRLESIRSLIYTIPAAPTSHKLAYILAYLSQNPLYFKLLLSEMILPMIDLFFKISPDPSSLHTFSQVNVNLSSVYRSNYAPAILQQLLSDENSRLQCTLSLCYLARKGSSREKYFTKVAVMEGLVSCMYDDKHPLRLLSITSYCHLISAVDASCECEFEFDEDEDLLERQYDVSFKLGDECVKSVKSRLAQRSEVFRAMFHSAFTEASSGQVVITDSSAEAFRLFNESLLSGRFNSLLFEVENVDILLGVLQLANRYLVRRLEEQIVSLVCSNMPVYFDAIIKGNSFLASRTLLVRCVLHVCKDVLSEDKYELITHLFKFIPKPDFTELSTRFIQSLCIHNV